MPITTYNQAELDAIHAEMRARLDVQAAQIDNHGDLLVSAFEMLGTHGDLIADLLARVTALENEQPPPQKTDRQKLLEWLSNPPGVVSGQHVGHGLWRIDEKYARFVDALHDQTGKYPGLIGMSYIGDNLDAANELLIEHWRNGGIVTVDHFAPNPWTGGTHNDITDADLGQLLDPTTEYHEAARARYIADLDRVAAGLASLRDAGVVVLWRPFHECTWKREFWWNWLEVEENKRHYIFLWQEMREYFDELGLDNLLWVYAPANASHRAPVEDWYPGDEYVDVVGISIYSDTMIVKPRDDLGIGENNYTIMTRWGHPFTFSECGPGTIRNGDYDNTVTIDAIRERYPRTAYFLQWHSWTDNDVAIVDCRNAAALMNDPFVLCCGDIDFE